MSTLTFTTRTKRHVVKSFDVTNPTTPVFLNSFGVIEVPGSDNSHLNLPWGVVRDTSNNAYVCDYDNHRIVKLSSSLTYNSSYDTELTIGNPSAIFLDSTSGDLYVAGMSYHSIDREVWATATLYHDKYIVVNNGSTYRCKLQHTSGSADDEPGVGVVWTTYWELSSTNIDSVHNVLYAYLGIERLTTSLVSVKSKRDVVVVTYRVNYDAIDDKLRFICRGFSSDEILIGGVRNVIYSTTETGSGFSDIIVRQIKGF